MPCPACGIENGPGRKFCRSCGGVLARVETSAARVAPAAPSRSVDRRSALPRWLFPTALVLVLTGLGASAWFFRARLASAAGALASKETAEERLAQAESLSAAKDSLYGELLETATLMSDVSQAVTAIQGGHNSPVLRGEVPGRPMTAREARALLMPKIDSLRARLTASEARLTASTDRMRGLVSAGTALQSRLAEFERTVASMKALVASQREQLATLDTEVSTLRADNQRLLRAQETFVATQGLLRDSLSIAQEAENTVYWIANSKAALLELGVVVEEGKGKVLVFGKGKSLAPARQLNLSDFTPINRATDLVIPLPRPGMRYRILTRQNLTAAQNVLDRDGHIRESLQITDPAAFWGPSRYLILVEDK